MEDCNRYGKRIFWHFLPMVLMLVCAASVMAIQVDESRPPKGSEIGKEIEEAQLHIGTIKFAGDSLGNREELLAILKSKSGAPLNRQLIRQDIQALIDFYDAKGYAFADVQPQLTRSADPTRIDLTVTIDKGELTYINQIHIEGHPRTSKKDILAVLPYSEGALFSNKNLKETKAKLQQTNWFEDVQVTAGPTLDPAKVDLYIKVKEKTERLTKEQ